MQYHDSHATAGLLDLRTLIVALEGVLREYGRNEVRSPERLVVPCADSVGLLLSMPCHAPDLLVHKLLTIYAANPSRGLPSIQGQVTAFDARDGAPLFCLDGPTVTARRTAAISMIGVARLRSKAPTLVAVIGTGAQARAHVEAILELHPGAEIRVRGASRADEEAFCAAFAASGRVAPHLPGPLGGEVVIAVTSSRSPVYDEPADPGRLVIGVGAYRLDMVEIGARTISGSQIYVDDPVGAPGEAGDVAAAGTDWATVTPLSVALDAPPDFGRPIFLKSVGCAAWDLAACRAARLALAGAQPANSQRL